MLTSFKKYLVWLVRTREGAALVVGALATGIFIELLVSIVT